MSLATFWTGARAQVAYQIPNTSSLAIFGHGQRLNTFEVNRNYEPIFTIGDRRMTHIPFGPFEVSWGVGVNLSDPTIFTLFFTPTGTATPTTWVVSSTPIYTTIHVWYSTAGDSNSHLMLLNSFADELRISVGTGRGGGIELTIGGNAVDLSYDSTPASSYTITIPQNIYTFVGATLAVGGTAVIVRGLDISLRQNADLVYGLGSDRAKGVYYGRLDLEATVRIPTYGQVTSLLGNLMSNQDVSSIVATFGGFGLSGNNPVQGFTLVLTSPYKITGYRVPLTEIGVNEAEIGIRFKDIQLIM